MINIRYKKRAKSNDYSVYLDIYIPKNKETNTPSKREYEFLNIYVSKDYSKEKRIVGTDKENIELAKSIAAKREIEIKNNEYGFKQANKNVDFFKFYERNENLKIYRYTALLKHLKDFAKSETIYFSDLTNDFLISFTNYLLSKTEPKINQTTIHGYLVALKTCFNRAIKQGIIQSNPMQNIEIPKAVETQRTTLELSELQLLKETKPKMNIIGETQLRQAFFFSCFTGLRLSDIQRITWNDLKDNQIRIIQYKTRNKKPEYNYIPLSETALQILTEIDKNPTDNRIFWNLPNKTTLGRYIQLWGVTANIKQHLHFHAARHTFATICLTYGTDLYTLKELLGHNSIEMTMIYGKIVNEKKRTAISKLPKL